MATLETRGQNEAVLLFELRQLITGLGCMTHVRNSWTRTILYVQLLLMKECQYIKLIISLHVTGQDHRRWITKWAIILLRGRARPGFRSKMTICSLAFLPLCSWLPKTPHRGSLVLYWLWFKRQCPLLAISLKSEESRDITTHTSLT